MNINIKFINAVIKDNPRRVRRCLQAGANPFIADNLGEMSNWVRCLIIEAKYEFVQNRLKNSQKENKNEI